MYDILCLTREQGQLPKDFLMWRYKFLSGVVKLYEKVYMWAYPSLVTKIKKSVGALCSIAKHCKIK